MRLSRDRPLAIEWCVPGSDQLLHLLATSPFGGASESAARRLAPLFVARRYEKGAVVFLEGDQGGRFFLIGDGSLKAFRTLPGGRSITVFNLAAGDFFGFIPLLDNGPYPLSVSALAPSTVYVLSRENFVLGLRDNPELSLLLLGYMAHRLRGCFEQVGQLGCRGAVTRTAHALLSLLPADGARSGSAEVVLPFSQAELAHTLDVTAENLSRALARLCRERTIERIGRRRFLIRDVAALGRVAGAN